MSVTVRLHLPLRTSLLRGFGCCRAVGLHTLQAVGGVAADAEAMKQSELRVFVHPISDGRVGGNPVTTFSVPAGETFPDESIRARAAATCQWECAFIQQGQKGQPGSMRFHVPSGAGMDLCAHAALGASVLLAQTTGAEEGTAAVTFRTTEGGKILSAQVSEREEGGWKASLALPSSSHLESELPAGLSQGLAQLGLDETHLASQLPLLNAGIMGRTKTLIPLVSAEAVQSAHAPADASAFQQWCDEAATTGIYLYAPLDSDSLEYECRQFPRASGYPEDPATGVAAMALALSLRAAGIGVSTSAYGFHQGRAMGMPSWIGVRLANNQQSGEETAVCEGLVMSSG